MRQYAVPFLSILFVAAGVAVFFSGSQEKSSIQVEAQPLLGNSSALETADPTTLTPGIPIQPDRLRVQVQTGDSLSGIFQRYGLDATQSYQLLQTEHGALLNRLQPGQELELEYTKRDNHLHELVLYGDDATETRYRFQNDRYASSQISLPVETKQTYQEVIITRSLQQDALAAGLSSSVIQTVTQVLASEIDFALDIRSGDQLAVLMTQYIRNGKQVQAPTIEALGFFNNGRYFEAFRFEGQQNTYYLTADGLSLQRRFLRAPLDYRRVSSRFNPNRLHPIFKTQRPHNGIDYAAEEGTPVLAAGNGTVSFIGEQKGYGNVVIIDHGQNYSTLYAHLNGFASGLGLGDEVKQGDEIAFVGQTGWATGPHLHYEFRIHGQHKNPGTVTIPYDAPLSKGELMEFLPKVTAIKTELTSRFSEKLKAKLRQ